MNCKSCGCQLEKGNKSCPACGHVNTGIVTNGGNTAKTIFLVIFIVMFILPFFMTIFSFVAVGNNFESFFEETKTNIQYSDDFSSVMDEYRFQNVDWENVLREMLEEQDVQDEEDFRDLIEENIIREN